MIKANNIFKLLYFLATALIIIAPALYNRYPLMYFDSGAYMEMAVKLEPEFHRAAGYPFLMYYTGWLVSNWPVVIMQGLLLSIVLFRLVHLLFPHRQWLYHFFTVLMLTFASSMPWYAAQLMPDVFTLILALTVIAVVLERKLSWTRIILYTLLLFLALVTHLSHAPLLALMLAALGVMTCFGRSYFVAVQRAKWVVLSGSLIAAVLATCTYNATHNLGFRMSLASNVFITANLGEMGILKLYLDENCGELQSGLCNIKDSLPLETGGYLWDIMGPVQTHPGEWEGANEEYAPIVRAFLLQPRYLKWFIVGAVKATFKQMFQVELGSGLKYRYVEGTPPYWPMKTHFRQELNEYLNSVQNKGDELPIDFFRMVQYISLLLSFGIIGWAVFERRLDPRLLTLLLLVILFYFFNAAITGVLANVYERLQCKLLPLIQFIALMVLFAARDKEAIKNPAS